MLKFKAHIVEEKAIRGLHQAKVGDHIRIGIEGTRGKRDVKIAKILANDRLVDEDGNIFQRNGMIIKRKAGFPSHFGKGKIVSAKLITQKEFDREFKDIKIRHITEYDWNKEDLATILKVIDLMKIGQGNPLKKSRFEK